MHSAVLQEPGELWPVVSGHGRIALIHIWLLRFPQVSRCQRDVSAIVLMLNFSDRQIILSSNSLGLAYLSMTCLRIVCLCMQLKICFLPSWTFIMTHWSVSVLVIEIDRFCLTSHDLISFCVPMCAIRNLLPLVMDFFSWLVDQYLFLSSMLLGLA